MNLCIFFVFTCSSASQSSSNTDNKRMCNLLFECEFRTYLFRSHISLYAISALLLTWSMLSTKKRNVDAGGKLDKSKSCDSVPAKQNTKPCWHKKYLWCSLSSSQCMRLHVFLLLLLHDTSSVSHFVVFFLRHRLWSFLISQRNWYAWCLSFISLVLNPRWLGQFFPNSKSLHDPNNILYRALAGPASGLATTLFMALLPQIFKFVAYYEGTSSSLEMAERKALLFMWYFMLVTAFFGQYLATMLLQWYYHGTLEELLSCGTVDLFSGTPFPHIFELNT